MDRILFVLPLEERFVCPEHKGVLREPVVSPSGQNVCKECLKKDDGSEPEVNTTLQEEIDSLLCYCKYGVMLNNGVLTTDPKGCDHIIRFGNRAQHEAVCEFQNSDFVMVNNAQEPKEAETEAEVKPPSTGPTLIPCSNKDDGCFFLAAAPEELETHLNECSYERLRKLLRQSESRVELLEKELKLRDSEIVELRNRLTEEQNKGASQYAKRTFDNGKVMLDEFIRVLEEELPQGVTTIKEQLLKSPAFMKSASTLSSLKTNVARKAENVRQNLAELHPLDSLSSLHPIDRLSELRPIISEKFADVHPIDRISEKIADVHPIDMISEKIADVRPSLNSSLELLADMHPLDKLIAILSNLKSDIMAYAAEYNRPAETSIVLDPNNNNNIETPIEDDGDEELKQQIAASIATYEEEKKARVEMEAREAVAIATASIRSLQDEMGTEIK